MRALMFASVASMVDLFNRDNMDMLEELGCKVDVAANFTEGSVYSKEQADAFAIEMKKAGREVIDVPIPRSMYNIKDMVKTIKILRKHMSVKHYDIVHCQSPIGGVLCRIACAPYRKEGMKVLYYAHGFHFFKGADLFYWLVFYNIEKWCAHITDCLITLNKEDYTRAAENFKTEVCYMKGVGLDLQEIYDVPVDRNGVRKELGLSEDTKIIVSVSELSRRKNCMTCLQAFAKAFLGESPAEEINAVRKRAYGANWDEALYGYGNDNVSSAYVDADNAGAVQAVLKERCREFILEGKRWYDLRLAGDDFVYAHSRAQRGKLLWPIDTDTRTQNPELLQTPSYEN